MTLKRTNKFTTSPRTFAASKPLHTSSSRAVDSCLRQCSHEGNSLQHLKRSRCRRIHLHAANIEEASDRSNHDCVLAASLTRSGGFFHRMDFLLGALRRHVSTLTTVPTSFDISRTLATSLALLTTLGLGLWMSKKIDTHLPDDQHFQNFGTFCQSEDSLEKCDPCFRTWNMLAESDCYVCLLLSIPCSPCPLLQCPSVSAVTEQRQSHEKSQPTSSLKSVHFFSLSTRIRKWVFSCISGNLSKHVPISISSSKILPLSRSYVAISRSQAVIRSVASPWTEQDRMNISCPAKRVLFIGSYFSVSCRQASRPSLSPVRNTMFRAPLQIMSIIQ